MGALADNYSAAPGVVINGGRFATIDLSGNWIVFGDSLTALTYNSGGYRWGLALTLLPPKVVYNAGFASDTLSMIYARQDADVTSKNPAVVMIRAGTNSLGDATSTFRSNYRLIIDKALAGGAKVVLCDIPFRNGFAQATIDAHNAWLSAQAAVDPTRILYLNDSTGLGMGDTVGDGIHMNGLGTYKQGKAQAAVLAAKLPQVSPLIASGTDIYPANGASDQWVQNPFNTGTAGTMNYATGTVPTGWSVNCGGVSVNSALCSILPADAGDANQTPWLRIELINGVANGGTGASTTLGNPSIAADLTVKRIDTMLEMRLVNLNMASVNSIVLSLSRSGVSVMPDQKIPATGGIGIINERMVIRNSYPRDEGSSGSVAPVAYPANSISLGIAVQFESSFTSSIGFIDIRRASARGQAA